MAACAAVIAKLVWKWSTGSALSAAALPSGVHVTPSVRGSGALAGALAVQPTCLWRTRRRANPSR